MPDIFISYRREETVAYAGRLHDRLAVHFGKDHVFMDIDTIKPGDDFVEVVEKTVAACDALIALVGKQWLRGTLDLLLLSPPCPASLLRCPNAGDCSG